MIPDLQTGLGVRFGYEQLWEDAENVPIRTLKVSPKRAKIEARAGPIWHYEALGGTRVPPTCSGGGGGTHSLHRLKPKHDRVFRTRPGGEGALTFCPPSFKAADAIVTKLGLQGPHDRMLVAA